MHINAVSNMKIRTAVLLLPALIAGCGKDAPQSVVRISDAGVLAQGAEVYRKHCATCHGDRAQGTFNWQKPGPDGKYPAPPLDGSAHAWHHPQAALERAIHQGTKAQGGNMPGWAGTLSDEDIRAVIAWFQSTWSDETFRIWADLDLRARTKPGG